LPSVDNAEKIILSIAYSLKGRQTPYRIDAVGRNTNLSDFVSAQPEGLRAIVLEHGSVLFRGFTLDSTADFQAFIGALDSKTMTYTYRSTPRTALDKDIFTATEYPSQLEIPLHCENSYQRSWPMWLAFCCINNATTGGQTPVADMRKVTAAIGASVLERFAKRGVMYIRHYHPYVDLSWEEVFQTKDRDEVGRFCMENRIDYDWLDGGILRTQQVCQGVAEHPLTKDIVFFNQAHLFHPSSLGEKAARDMERLFSATRMPRNACYGDGNEIDLDDLIQVRAAFETYAINVEWQKGDVLILDNMQFAHGRRAFTGKRLVLASFLDPYRLSTPARPSYR
jgi:alpha-ketoglutarate-dependent taurine dioxygenase